MAASSPLPAIQSNSCTTSFARTARFLVLATPSSCSLTVRFSAHRYFVGLARCSASAWLVCGSPCTTTHYSTTFSSRRQTRNSGFARPTLTCLKVCVCVCACATSAWPDCIVTNLLAHHGVRNAYAQDVVGEDAFAVQTPIKTLFRGGTARRLAAVGTCFMHTHYHAFFWRLSGMGQSKYFGFGELIVSEINEYLDVWEKELRAQPAGFRKRIPLFDGAWAHPDLPVCARGHLTLTVWVCVPACTAFNELVLFTTARCLVR